MAKTYEEINAEAATGSTFGQNPEIFNAATPEQRMIWMGLDPKTGRPPVTSPGYGTEDAVINTGDSLTRVNDMASKLGLSTAQSDQARKQEILNQEAEARAARASAAESIFGQKLARAETVGQQQIAGQKGIAGQSAGFNMSTANMAIMNNVQKNLEDKKGEIIKEKQAYIDSGNYEASQRADAAIQALEDRSLSILLKKAEWAMNLDQQEKENVRADKTLEYNLASETRAISAEERATAQKEKDTIRELDMTYPNAGILPGDGIDDAITKVGPYIEENRKLELEKLKAEVAAVQRSNRGGGVGSVTQEDIDLANSIVGTVIVDGQIDYALLNKAVANMPSKQAARVTNIILKGIGNKGTEEPGTTETPVSQYASSGYYSKIPISQYAQKLKDDKLTNANIRSLLKSAGYSEDSINSVAPPSVGSVIDDVSKYIFGR